MSTLMSSWPRPGVAVLAALGLVSCALPITEPDPAGDDPPVAAAAEALTNGGQVWVHTADAGWIQVYSDDNRLRVRGTVSNAAVGLSGVTVRVRGCETCSSLSATSSSTGSYEVVATSSVSLYPSGEDASRIEFTRSGYLPVTVYHTPDLEKYQDGAVKRARTVPQTVIMGTSDSDADGLSNSAEAYYGTSPTNADTDGDDLSDNAEIYGANWIDYPALGADPLHYDVFVELDFEQNYSTGQGFAGDLTPEAAAKIEEIYDDIALTNPDGATGITVHLMDDTLLPEGINCWDPADGATYDGNYRHGRWTDAFVYGCLSVLAEPAACCSNPDTCSFSEEGTCDNAGAGGGKGGPGHFHVGISAVRYQSYDRRNFYQMSVVAHELGHGLGLEHGGEEADSNCKPNYPSLMNYSYDYSFMGSPHTIAETQIQFSKGLLTALAFELNEVGGDSEWSAFEGLPAGVSVEFIEYFENVGFPVSGYHVDFNRDGDFNDWAMGWVDPADHTLGTAFRSKTGCTEENLTLMTLKDYNDGSLIKANAGMLGMPGASRAGVVEEYELEASGLSRPEIARRMRDFHTERLRRAREELRQAQFARGIDPDAPLKPCK